MAAVFRVEDPEGKIDEAVRRIVHRFRPEKMIRFGSRARRNPRPGSDADLLIVMKVQGSRLMDAAQIDLARAGIGIPKDIVLVTLEEFARYRDFVGTVVFPAVRIGKVLYDRAA
jgi:predicted nucleotidyltransferase